MEMVTMVVLSMVSMITLTLTLKMTMVVTRGDGDGEDAVARGEMIDAMTMMMTTALQQSSLPLGNCPVSRNH